MAQFYPALSSSFIDGIDGRLQLGIDTLQKLVALQGYVDIGYDAVTLQHRVIRGQELCHVIAKYSAI